MTRLNSEYTMLTVEVVRPTKRAPPRCPHAHTARCHAEARRTAERAERWAAARPDHQANHTPPRSQGNAEKAQRPQGNTRARSERLRDRTGESRSTTRQRRRPNTPSSGRAVVRTRALSSEHFSTAQHDHFIFGARLSTCAQSSTPLHALAALSVLFLSQ